MYAANLSHRLRLGFANRTYYTILLNSHFALKGLVFAKDMVCMPLSSAVA